VIDVFFGESRTYIKGTLADRLGWERRDWVYWMRAPDGKWLAADEIASVENGVAGAAGKLYERDGKYCFDLAIPGVVRGRLNGARGVEGKVENGVLVIDVRELLSPVNS
jgi:hypothetical protein